MTHSTQMEQNHEKSELLDFQILVLGTASWPLQAPSTGFNIPDDVGISSGGHLSKTNALLTVLTHR